MKARNIPKQHVVRAYIRDVPGASARTQRDALAKFAPGAVVYDAGERDAWVKSIGPNCTGWVFRLDLIALPKQKGNPPPTQDYAATMGDLMQRVGAGARLVEAASEATTDDADAWRTAVKRGHSILVLGKRKLTPRRAKEIGLKGLEVQADTTSKRLMRALAHEHRERVSALWRSQEYPNREAAAVAVSQYLREHQLPQLGAWRTLERTLGGRRATKRRR